MPGFLKSALLPDVTLHLTLWPVTPIWHGAKELSIKCEEKKALSSLHIGMYFQISPTIIIEFWKKEIILYLPFKIKWKLQLRIYFLTVQSHPRLEPLDSISHGSFATEWKPLPRGNKFIDVTIVDSIADIFILLSRSVCRNSSKICISRTNLKLSRDRENLKGISRVSKSHFALGCVWKHKSLDGLPEQTFIF